MDNVIGMASDHAGYELKEKLKAYLIEKGYKVEDFGTYSSESADYADFAHPLANFVEENKCKFGVTICGSGNGITMTVNKHQKIRAALCWTPEIAALAVQHNNANICSMPARYITEEQAKEIVDVFINSEFEGGRHQKRIDKIPL